MNVLVLEDNDADFLEIERHLKLDGALSTCRRVTCLEELEGATNSTTWDVVLAESSVPGLDFVGGFNVARARMPGVPVILVSRNIDEREATELLKLGVWDFLRKEDLHRLAHLVRHAIRESVQRRAQCAAEQALLRSEERYRQVFLSASDSLFVFPLGQDGQPGRFTEVNKAASEMLGYERDELLQFSPPDLVDETDRERLPAKFQELLEQRRQHVELLLVAKDGRRVQVQISGSLFDVEGQPTVLGILRDVTEHKRIEHALQASEARYRQILETAQEGIWMIDRDHKTTFVNPKMAELLGYTANEMIGANLFDFMDDEAKAVARLSLARREQGVSEELEIRYRRKDGTAMWALVKANPVLADDGTLVGALAMVSDISDRKRAETELRLQSAVLSASADAIIITDPDGTIAWVNPAFTELTGYSTNDCLGENPRNLLKSGAQDQMFYKDLWDTIRSGHAWRGEMINRRKDGSRYTENMTITPVKNTAGEITHFVAIKRDLTEEKRLKAQFMQAQKMESVGRLAGGIAHDFNNLLTVINGVAELASGSLKDGDPLRSDLEEIQRAGERAAALTRQLLAFSRKQIMQPQVLSLATLVGDLRSLLQRMIGEDVTLVVAPTGSKCKVKADPGQIEQAIMNLVVNARDAMPKGGVLTIQTQDVGLAEARAAGVTSAHAGPYVLLSVGDTGTGMDDATRARLFEPFFTTKEQGKGTGLGLATVYGIVEQSGGSIAVDSVLGRGTTFKIYLPQVAEEVVARRSTAAAPGDVATETILVVEDEDGVRHMAKRMLAPAGYTVLTARNAAEALLVLERQEGTVDLMLTDVVMPEMSGPDLAARVAETRPRLKVLFMSGHTENAALCRSVRDDVAHFINKPYTKADLLRKVRESLDLPGNEAASMTPAFVVEGEGCAYGDSARC